MSDTRLEQTELQNHPALAQPNPVKSTSMKKLPSLL